MSESTFVVNREFAENDKRFRIACSLAGIQATKRQASKFRRGFGSAEVAMRAFIGGGYAEKSGRLQADMAKATKNLNNLNEELEGMSGDEKSSDQGAALAEAIESAKQKIESLEVDLNGLKINLKILTS
ncbi:MAG: hypothetical protein A2934_02485 [Candidatus Sungbacteria bacterium RIFCSPLOWO2_01_FULL_47_10]|uniref:Uncharacterized protein n=1 Tax=Candidatus Sungbacteria bacterium RIFCSPLOWO2_01_FULL_47_10 TaxID=1802276 RepID=A0A1G2L9E5_9BACT|nr:MAG: hypothetical protein A2934_02485 [Candidatus Sungbacteria bacterium RIFCSPLOWO2_01_FULL_47_10]